MGNQQQLCGASGLDGSVETFISHVELIVLGWDLGSSAGNLKDVITEIVILF